VTVLSIGRRRDDRRDDVSVGGDALTWIVDGVGQDLASDGISAHGLDLLLGWRSGNSRLTGGLVDSIVGGAIDHVSEDGTFHVIANAARAFRRAAKEELLSVNVAQ